MKTTEQFINKWKNTFGMSVEEILEEAQKEAYNEGYQNGYNEARKVIASQVIDNHPLWHIEPFFDEISTAVTNYRVVDQNGMLIYVGSKDECETFLKYYG